MKRIGFWSMVLLVISFSCEKKEQEKQIILVPEDPAPMSKNLSIEPVMMVEEVKSKFRKGAKGCQEGFGICDVVAVKTDTLVGETVSDTIQEEYRAKFVLSKDDNEMLIEFTEHIPHFSNEFVVDLMSGVPELFGYEYVRLIPGVYQTDGGIGEYGGVVVKVEKGRKLEEEAVGMNFSQKVFPKKEVSLIWSENSQLYYKIKKTRQPSVFFHLV
ncbi:MAG: hypothetical protein NVV82_25015 [Sporocytophaga sp.]|nr:hypothetical protein [Sporocytophaga sp.]